MKRTGAFAAFLAMSCLLLAFGVVWAAPYFEFNPDYAQSLLIASSPGAVSEVFLPINDYLAGVDFWVSNASVAGTMTFTLYNPSDAVVAVRTISVPAIADSENGTRLTVNLPSQLPVNGSVAYRMGMATSVPTMRVYYAQQSRILTHNGVPLPAYTGGLARIGSDDQGYSFTFALTENNESSPPQLSGVTVQQPAIGTAILEFFANEPVDAQVTYNTSAVPFSGQYSSCPTGLVPCSSSLTVLPGVEYSYTLTVRDVWGNLSATTGQFTAVGTPPDPTPTPTPTSVPTTATPTPSSPPDTTSPVITNARAANVTINSAAIAWTTDEAANGTVAVFALPYLTFAAGDSDGTLELEHAISVAGLQESLLYRAIITTVDGFGNSTSTSFNFLTTNPTPVPVGPTPTPTVLVSPTASPTVSVGPTGGSGTSEVSWSPPASGTPTDGYRVDIIGADGKLIRTFRTTTTSVNVGSIPDGATVVVYSDNDGLFEKVAVPAQVSHESFLERLVAALPYILGGLVIVLAVTVGFVTWRKRSKLPPTTPSAGVPAAPSGGSLKAQAEALGSKTI